MSQIIRIKSISQVHQELGIKTPKHPLVSVIPIDERVANYDYGDATYVFDFFQISLKTGISGEIKYGRNTYDFQEGSMVFIKPGQAMSFSDHEDQPDGGGWTLLFHPDLIRKSELGQNINAFSFFSYDTHEALHVSEQERASLNQIIKQIETEYQNNIDQHTQKLIVANIELLLNYCTRFYDRQFYVRTNMSQDIIVRFERLLSDYFNSEQPLKTGLPTVKHCGEQLNLSPSHLSDLLKKETGKTAQQHIHEKIIDSAKTLLLGTEKQVGQIAYSLGFEYAPHFSKLFKNSTGLSPAQYRKSH